MWSKHKTPELPESTLIRAAEPEGADGCLRRGKPVKHSCTHETRAVKEADDIAAAKWLTTEVVPSTNYDLSLYSRDRADLEH